MTAPRRPGRPCKLSAETRSKLLVAIQEGNTLSASCTRAGISYATFNEWMKKGEETGSGEFYELAQAVQEAESEAEAALVSLIRRAAKDDWKAAAHILACRSRDWVVKNKLEAKIEGNATTTMKIIKIDLIGDEEILIHNLRFDREEIVPLLKEAAAKAHSTHVRIILEDLVAMVEAPDRIREPAR